MKNALLIYTQDTFFIIIIIREVFKDIYGFRMGPLYATYTGLFFLYARNIDCILSKPTQLHFFSHIFLCSVKIVLLPPPHTTSHIHVVTYPAITIGMTCVLDIRDTLEQIYNVNGRILRIKCYVNITWFTTKDKYKKKGVKKNRY